MLHSCTKGGAFRWCKVCYTLVVMFNLGLLVASLISLVVLAVILNLTTPTEIGPLGVLVFLTTCYVLLFGIANLLVGLFFKLIGKKQSQRKTRLYGVVVAFAPVMLLLARAFGSMNWWTLGLVGLFEILGCFLVYKRV